MLLASARALHADKLALLVKGIDEQEEAERERRAMDGLFINVATKWFVVKKPKFQPTTQTISGNRSSAMCSRLSGRYTLQN